MPKAIFAYGPGATLSQDLEPEYIAEGPDGTAYVTLQEHNAFAIIDIRAARVKQLVHLGFKDHRLAENAFDASDRDGGIKILTWPVKGMYQPDAVVSLKKGRHTYFITAKEGDVREWGLQ